MTVPDRQNPEESSSDIVFFLIAGEPSGDKLGAQLIKDLKGLLPAAQFLGIGGPAMEKEGLDSLFPIHELAIMGLSEVVPRIPRLLRRIRQTVKHIQAIRPQMVITIDSPDFCHRVTRRLQPTGIKLVHYVAPSVWAWRPGRAAKLAKIYDHLLALLPFEPPYFEKAGLESTFVGHPVAGIDANGSGKRFRNKYEIAASTRIIGLFPGSRNGEVGRLLPIFLSVAQKISTETPAPVTFVIPTVSNTHEQVLDFIRDSPLSISVVSSETDKSDALSAFDLAIAASGTVALELAQSCVPAIIAYKVTWLTALIARRLIKTPYVSIINILEGRVVTPELLQENCTVQKITQAADTLLTREDCRHRQVQGYKSALVKLTPPMQGATSVAAATVLNILNQK